MAKRTNKLIVCDLGRVKLNPECLGMVGISRADLTIGRVCHLRITTGVSNRGFEDAFIVLDGPVLEEDMFDAPKAAGCKGGDL